MTSTWVFGHVICNVWISLDVLCCTSSILHLVAISLDRYWAVTRVDYARNRSSTRIGLMIAFSWTLSAIISTAPMVGWGRTGQWIPQTASWSDVTDLPLVAVQPSANGRSGIDAVPYNFSHNHTSVSSASILQFQSLEDAPNPGNISTSESHKTEIMDSLESKPTLTTVMADFDMVGEELIDCIISQDKSYTIFSTVGAFYIPLIFMTIVYLLIYRAARERIRGGKHAKNWAPSAEVTKTSLVIDNSPEVTPSRRLSTLLLPRPRGKSHSICATALPGPATPHLPQVQRLRTSVDALKLEALTDEGLSKLRHSTSAAGSLGVRTTSEAAGRLQPIKDVIPGSDTAIETGRASAARASFASTIGSMGSVDCVSYSSDGHLSTLSEETGTSSKDFNSYVNTDRTRQIRSTSTGTKASEASRAREKREQRKERKAARTLAIITGSFMCCWMPFFVMALISPFCGPACDPPLLVRSVIDWLGYINSLFNPIIYTIFSPDFRSAFRKILYGRYGGKLEAKQNKNTRDARTKARL